MKRLVADLSLDKVMLQDVVQGVPLCAVAPSVYYYRSCEDPLIALRQRVREFAHARVRFGYRRIYMLLKREGWDVGKDRLYRVLSRGRPGIATQAAVAACVGCAS